MFLPPSPHCACSPPAYSGCVVIPGVGVVDWLGGCRRHLTTTNTNVDVNVNVPGSSSSGGSGSSSNGNNQNSNNNRQGQDQQQQGQQGQTAVNVKAPFTDVAVDAGKSGRCVRRASGRAHS